MSITNKTSKRKYWSFVSEIDGRLLDASAHFTLIFHRYFKRANRYLHRLSSIQIAEHNYHEGRVNPFPTIALLPQLQRLDLSDCFTLQSPTTDYLSFLTNLTDLSIARCRGLRDDYSVAYWSRFWLRCGAKLRRLNISGCDSLAATSGFRYLTCLSSLTKLEAGGIVLRSTLTLPVFQLTNLVSLDFRDASLAADMDFKPMSKLQSLTSLNMSHVGSISDDIVRQIATLRGLTDLDLGRTRKAISSANGFIRLTNLHNLVRLNLQQSFDLPDGTLAALLRSMPRLQLINLRYCFQISLNGALALGACKDLRLADLTQTAVSKEFDDNAEELQRIVGLSSLEIMMEEP
jgi:hypothetical protein